MEYLEMNDEEMSALMEHLYKIVDNLEEYMNDSYENLMFLGTSPRRMDGVLLESVLINLNICLYYYVSKESYIKAYELNKLYKLITDNGPRQIDIEEEILKSIVISLN
jgi:hypothetical protein